MPGERGTAPGDLADRRRAVQSDPVLKAVLAALDRFGDAGRFYYLDQLSARPQKEESPQALWTGMTRAITRDEPSMLSAINAAATYEEGRRALNDVIVESLTRWWDFYVAAWRTGAIGDEARRCSSELDLVLPATV
jgi:hypothetical protein